MISEINVVPYIDVMLVLLVIFMITAPLITTGIIDLPEVSKVTPKKENIIEVKILKNESITIKKRKEGAKEELVTFSELPSAVKNLINNDENTAVVISADKNVTYELVAKAIDNLNKGGVSRVGLLVRQKNN
jgi:biopolymer transport protein TolR